jgi:hypothetical protein
MDDTTNEWVIEDLIHALLELPSKNGTRLIEKTISWARSDRVGVLSAELVRLAAKFAEEGKQSAALKLAKSVLEPQETPRLAQLSQDSEERFLMSSATSRCDLSQYDEILKNRVPPLIAATSFAGFHLICDLLDRGPVSSVVSRK